METNIRTIDDPLIYSYDIDIVEGKGWLKNTLYRSNKNVFVTTDVDGIYISHRTENEALQAKTISDETKELVRFELAKNTKINEIAETFGITLSQTVRIISEPKAVKKVVKSDFEHLTPDQKSGITEMYRNGISSEKIALKMDMELARVQAYVLGKLKGEVTPRLSEQDKYKVLKMFNKNVSCTRTAFLLGFSYEAVKSVQIEYPDLKKWQPENCTVEFVRDDKNGLFGLTEQALALVRKMGLKSMYAPEIAQKTGIELKIVKQILK